MPKMNLTDTDIERAKLADKQVWYSHKTDRYPGLRLCISKTAKTFYVTKWDPVAGRVVNRKLGRFSKDAYTVTMAWRDAQANASRIDAGDVPEPEPSERPALPTLREAVEEYVGYMVALNPKVAKPMTRATAQKYRRAVEQHLPKWCDVRIDELPTYEIRQHLNALQAKMPYGSMYCHTAIGATIRWQNKERDLELKVPGLTKVTKTAKAEVDRSIPWPDRWEEIEAIENATIRAAWKFRWLTGIRVQAFIGCKWTDFNEAFGTLSLPQDKRHPARVVALADAALDLLKSLPRKSEFIFATAKADHVWHGLDRLPLTTARELRHLWHDAAEEVDVSPKTAKWLAGQIEKDIQGHYTQPSLEKQRDAANRIAAYIIRRAQTGPQNVVEVHRTSA